MLWGLGTGRCGTTSYAKQIGADQEPHPSLDVDDPGEIYRRLIERYERGRDVVDPRQSLLVPQILAIDPSPQFVWIIRNPWHCVRSMVTAQHLRAPSVRHFPVSADEPVMQASLFWLRINRGIYEEAMVKWPLNTTLIETESLELHEGRGFDDEPFGEVNRRVVSDVCGSFWFQFRCQFPDLYHEKSREREPKRAVG